MSQLLIEDFRYGLDRRKFFLNSPAGTLYVLENAHITSGGEIEKRKKFHYQYLPTNCYGLENTENGLEVFGSVAQADLTAGTQVATTKRARTSNVATLTFAADPNIEVGDIVTVTSVGGASYNAAQVTVTAASSAAPWTISYANTAANEAETTDTAGRVAPVLPYGVTYTRLQHPDDATAAMTSVVHSTVYNAAAFVIADYGADGIVTFYDGAVVDDLSPGRLAFVLANADSLAEYIASLVNGSDDYTAAVADGVVTITGPEKQAYTITSANESSCDTPDDLDGETITAISLTSSGNVTFTEPAASNGVDFSFEISYKRGATDDLLVNDTYEDDDGPGVYNNTWNLGTLLAAVPRTPLAGPTSQIEVVFTINNGLTLSSAPTEWVLSYTVAGVARQIRKYISAAGTTSFPLTPATPTIVEEQITAPFDGFDGTPPRAQFEVVAVDDTSTAATNQCVQVTVDKGGANEAELITTPVEVAASTQAMAAAIANEINLSAEPFTAEAAGSVVVITADQDYDTWNGKSLTVEVAGAVVVGRGQVVLVKLAGSVTVPTVTDFKIADTSVITATDVTAADAPASGTTVADLATNVAYRINTDADAHPTEYFAAAVGDSVFVGRRFTASNDVAQTITLTLTDGTTGPGDGVAMAATAAPASVGVATIESGIYPRFTTARVSVSVQGGVPPFLYKWEQTTSTPVWIDSPTSSSTTFRVFKSSVPSGGLTAQFKCVVKDSSGLEVSSNVVTAQFV